MITLETFVETFETLALNKITSANNQNKLIFKCSCTGIIFFFCVIKFYILEQTEKLRNRAEQDCCDLITDMEENLHIYLNLIMIFKKK